ncbi:MAG: hypothetical protein WC435_00925 [Candidatus Paceibacterota bacterium]
MKRIVGMSLFMSLIVVSVLLGNFVSHKINCWAEFGGEWRKEVVLSMQLMDFMQSGGGPAGPTENYFAWAYAKKILSPRPWWHHVLFPTGLVFQPFGYWTVPEKEFHHPALVSFIEKP